MTVCVIYGWAEGQWHGRALRRALQKAGYSINYDPNQADIIIAHSAGCYMIPDTQKARMVLLVGLPYWPGKHPVKSTIEKIVSDPKDLFWYRKTLHNIYYLFARPLDWLKMKRSWAKQSLPVNQNVKIILIRNDNDPYLNQTEGQLLAKRNGWIFKALTGLHDDLWVHPEFYTDILAANLDPKIN